MVGGGEATRGGAWQAAAGRRRPAASPPRRRASASSLSALRAAVAHEPGRAAAAPVPVGGRTAKDTFPMEDDFKEF
jgi:hypothetical protein